jgi:restriction system protein
MAKPKHVWMVRAGDNNELAEPFWAKHAVAIGWDELGDLAPLRERDEFKKRYSKAYPEDSPGQVPVNAGQLYRFTREIGVGDYVLSYVKASREILIGIVEGDYEYRPGLVYEEHYSHVRRVRWLKRVSRDVFSAPARNSMGSTLTVFGLDDHLDEIHRVATTTPSVVIEEEKDEEPPFYEEVKAKADELIADMVSRLAPYEFQEMVAALLQAMQFRVVSSPPGSDRGVDIVAHPDPFGFERPLIKAQVKHRKGTVSGPEMRSFIGALRDGDNGLYVSTGGYTPDAKREAESSREPVKLLDRDDFIRLLLEHYEALDPEYKARVPLRKVWVPAE